MCPERMTIDRVTVGGAGGAVAMVVSGWLRGPSRSPLAGQYDTLIGGRSVMLAFRTVARTFGANWQAAGLGYKVDAVARVPLGAQLRIEVPASRR